MTIDPEQYYRDLAELQGAAQEAEAKCNYLWTKFELKIGEAENERKNPNRETGELDTFREAAHDILDEYFDALFTQRQLADAFRGKYEAEAKDSKPDT